MKKENKQAEGLFKSERLRFDAHALENAQMVLSSDLFWEKPVAQNIKSALLVILSACTERFELSL